MCVPPPLHIHTPLSAAVLTILYQLCSALAHDKHIHHCWRCYWYLQPTPPHTHTHTHNSLEFFSLIYNLVLFNISYCVLIRLGHGNCLTELVYLPQSVNESSSSRCFLLCNARAVCGVTILGYGCSCITRYLLTCTQVHESFDC